MASLRFATILGLAAFVSVLSPAFAAPQDTPKASFRLAKDNEYLFLTVKVETTDIQGLTKGLSPQSIPAILKDDCVILSLLPDGGKPVTITYSPAGGFGYTKDGIPAAYFKMKYGIGIDGTIGDATDKDSSWHVEAAIPWDALGCAPNTPLRGYLQIRKKDAAAVVTFPDGVDAATPAAWPKLVAPFALVPKTAIPLIDGRIDKTEWPEAETQIALPAWQTKQTSTIIAVLKGVAPTLDEARNPAGIKSIGALYFASTNADLLKPSSPTRGVIARDGSIGFIDQPFLGMGPWYSSDRVDHHRRELLGMQRAGIDVAYCVTGGTGVAGVLDMKAQMVVSAAKQELAQRGEATPALAPYIVIPADDAPLDATTQAGLDRLWDVIHRWVIATPPQMRHMTAVGATTPTGSAMAIPVVIDGESVILPSDASWANTLRQRFAERFGATAGSPTLVFIGGEKLTSNSSGLFGSVGRNLRPAAPNIAIVSPGGQRPFVPRKLGETYKQSWDASRSADWVLINSWNDFAAGNEIAPSRQYGEGYVGLTRLYKTNGTAGSLVDVRVQTSGIPAVVASPELFVANVVIQNKGTAPLEPSAVKVGYRWLQNDKIVASTPTSSRLTSLLAGGTTVTAKVGVLCSIDGSTPLPDGDYVLEFVTETANTTRTISQAVTVRSKTSYAEIRATSMSTLQRTGARVPVTADVRFAGSSGIPAGTYKLYWRVLTADKTMVLSTGETQQGKALRPGAWEQLQATIDFRDADRQPLAGAYPEQTGTAEGATLPSHVWVQFLIKDSEGNVITEPFEQSAAVYPGNEEARVRLVAPLGQTTFSAGSEGNVAVNIANTGIEKWAKGSVGLTGRWFQADGFPMSVNLALPTEYIKTEVPVGESTDLQVIFRVPDRPGRYILAVLPMRPPDFFLTTHPVTRSEDAVFIGITVTGGRAVMIDLQEKFDTDAVAYENAPRDGDVDGLGGTFPGEWFPADRYGINAGQQFFPSGYASDISSEIVRSTSFKFGSTAPGAKNAVSGKGQRIDVPVNKYVALHIAAVVIGKEPKPVQLTLRYKDGKTEVVTRTVRDWTSPVRVDEAISMRFPRKRMPTGDQDALLAWQHLVIPVRPSADLVGIDLPKDASLKIFAISLER